MTWLDYGIIAITGTSTLFGVLRGFAKEAWSLFTWIAALSLGFFYAEEARPFFEDLVDGIVAQYAAAFLSIVVLVFTTSSLIRLVFAQFFYVSELGSLNRLLGLLFGLGRGTLVIAILIILLGMSSVSKTTAWSNSRIIPHVTPISDWLLEKLPKPSRNEGEVELPKES